ncbi:hypothetical protein AAHE18_14G194800 [Arachis hypogaea]|uniref:Thiamine pyrophosphate enzyme TPP-binding domain-containing protein n=1 Tax=Arachis hypogaea TaxID=3818 RepID=A0A444ZR42_ARAHY|nr:hypothetical protein Ahy_B04g073708 isoform A [Arachis hypogaea]
MYRATENIIPYQVLVVVIIFNNGSVYSGDWRTPEVMNELHKDDPTPTSFVTKAG